MAWLVTGGAGYIGAHVVRAFMEEGMDVVVLDDISSGHRSFVPNGVPFVEGSLLDNEALARAFGEHHITGVVHLAGYKYAGVSVHKPVHTYEQNVTGTLKLLDAMDTYGVNLLVFSSSAGVYGTPDVERVTEDTPPNPQSPYGQSKLFGELIIADQATAIEQRNDGTKLRHTSLRYFNVVGSGTTDICDTSPHNLFPLVIKALEEGRVPRINGIDYQTPDGTCVRDYVHVADLARTHVAAAKLIEQGHQLERVYNLGSGKGASVREIMDAFAEVTGINFEPEIGERRPGDPDQIVAEGKLAAADLGWENRFSINEMVESAWAARHAVSIGDGR